MSSQAGRVQRFPMEIWRQMSSIDLRLLDELMYLSKRHADSVPSGAHYCLPGRKYLAEKLGCSVVTVSRHVAHLKRLGCLEAFQRRPIHGKWRTNFYRVRAWAAWRWGRVMGAVSSFSSRVSSVMHIASPSESNLSVERRRRLLRAQLCTLEGSGRGS